MFAFVSRFPHLTLIVDEVILVDDDVGAVSLGERKELQVPSPAPVPSHPRQVVPPCLPRLHEMGVVVSVDGHGLSEPFPHFAVTVLGPEKMERH